LRRPAWHKIVLCLASVPVAVLCNAIRVLATTLFFHYSQSTVLEEQFHDAAGLAMMPLAILMLLGVLKLLGLFSEQPEVGADSDADGDLSDRETSEVTS